jgi:predicted aminopeptidase
MLGDAAAMVEASVLTDTAFAESYRTLVARAGGPVAPRWIAMASTRPGDPEDARVWFLVGLPGNLVALELVSGGAHATYLFRVAPRATFDERRVDPAQLTAAVREISEALVDARFLREPMSLPRDRLAEPRYLRYRLAIAALPSLAVARARFVARIVHADPTSWAAALDDLIRWHGSARDEEAVWPGRAGMEMQIEATQSREDAPDS